MVSYIELLSFSNRLLLFFKGLVFVYKVSGFIIVIIFPLFFIYSVKFYQSGVVSIYGRGSSGFTYIRFIKLYIVIILLSTYLFLILFIQLVIYFNNYLNKGVKQFRLFFLVDIIFNFFFKALVEDFNQGFLSLVKFSYNLFKLSYIVSSGSSLLKICKLLSSFFIFIRVSKSAKELVLKGFIV